MEDKKKTAGLLNKVSFYGHKGKNKAVLGRSRLQFLTIKVGEIGLSLAQSEAFVTKYIELFY